MKKLLNKSNFKFYFKFLILFGLSALTTNLFINWLYRLDHPMLCALGFFAGLVLLKEYIIIIWQEANEKWLNNKD